MPKDHTTDEHWCYTAAASTKMHVGPESVEARYVHTKYPRKWEHTTTPPHLTARLKSFLKTHEAAMWLMQLAAYNAVAAEMVALSMISYQAILAPIC